MMTKLARVLRMRVSFFGLLRDMFEPQRHLTLFAMVRFFLTFASLQWVINSTVPLLEHAGQQCLGTEANLDAHWLKQDLFAVLLPFASFAVAMIWNWASYLNNTKSSSESPIPEPHPGLILLLSTYNPKASTIAGVGQLESQLDELAANQAAGQPRFEKIGALRAEILRSNWGPMLVAVQHHASSLKACWVVCTEGEKGSAPQFGTTKKLIHFFAKPSVKVDPVELDNAFDIAACTVRIQKVLQDKAPGAELKPRDVILDITGGTATMSCGAVVAAWAEDRKVEYFRQDQLLFNPANGEALTPGEIGRKPILVKLTNHAKLLPSGESESSMSIGQAAT